MEYYTKFLNNLKNYTIYLQKIAKEQFHTDLYFSIRNFKRFLDIISNNNTLRDKILSGTAVVFNMFRAALDACYTDYLSMDMDNSEALLNFKRRDKQRIKFLQELYKSYLKARYLKSYYIIHEKEVKEILDDKNNKEEENNMVETNFATIGCIKILENELNRKGNNTNFTINEEKKVVTLVAHNQNKEVTMVKCHAEDDFDKYVGAALAYMYNKFGSKSAYRKWVDENSKLIPKKKIKEDIKKPRPKKTPKKLADEYMEAQIPEVKEVK